MCRLQGSQLATMYLGSSPVTPLPLVWCTHVASYVHTPGIMFLHRHPSRTSTLSRVRRYARVDPLAHDWLTDHPNPRARPPTMSAVTLATTTPKIIPTMMVARRFSVRSSDPDTVDQLSQLFDTDANGHAPDDQVTPVLRLPVHP